ncbi:MAG TPA: universal stress protein [Micromonosporaceae bacterium]|nr:universal stress protein [Micromonosporaceae bacterium]
MNTKPIVVGYDGSPSSVAAVDWAAAEGLRTGRPVVLAHAFMQPTTPAVLPGPGVFPHMAARRDAEDMIFQAAAEAALSHLGVDITGVLLSGPPAVMLCEQSRQASLIVLGNRGRGGFAQLLLGSTGVAVSAHAHCPVVVVRGDRQPSEAPVLVGVDGSPSSVQALRYAFEQALDRAVQLNVVRAWNTPTPTRMPSDVLQDIVAAEQAELDEELTAWQAKYPDVEVTGEVVADLASRVLVQGSRDAQLVVVGSRGRGGFRGLLLGSVSQQLLHHSHCPVAVIRELPDTEIEEEIAETAF